MMEVGSSTSLLQEIRMVPAARSDIANLFMTVSCKFLVVSFWLNVHVHIDEVFFDLRVSLELEAEADTTMLMELQMVAT